MNTLSEAFAAFSRCHEENSAVLEPSLKQGIYHTYPYGRFDFDALTRLPTLLEQPERLNLLHLRGLVSQLLPGV